MNGFIAFGTTMPGWATGSNLKTTLDIATALAAIAAAIATRSAARTAKIALGAWEGKRNKKIVHKALASVYKFRGRLDAVRRQWMKAADYANRPNRNEEGMACAGQDREYAYNQRWFQADEAYSELEVRLAEVEAIWPDDSLSVARQKLLDCKNLLENSFGLYMRSFHGQHHFETPEKMQENCLIVFSSGTADLFKPKLDDAVRAFEQQLRPKLS